jgi:hypothetical protein
MDFSSTVKKEDDLPILSFSFFWLSIRNFPSLRGTFPGLNQSFNFTYSSQARLDLFTGFSLSPLNLEFRSGKAWQPP